MNTLPSLKSMNAEIAILGIAQTALTSLVAAQIGAGDFESIKAACRKSVYWSQFCAAVTDGAVAEGWIAGALGKVVVDWAREEANGK